MNGKSNEEIVDEIIRAASELKAFGAKGAPLGNWRGELLRALADLRAAETYMARAIRE